MRVDYSPLYRSTVGFDRLFSLLDQTVSNETNSYPPYNIERTGENAYRITMAVAGFGPDELNVETKNHTLHVRGDKSADAKSDTRELLYRGIAARNFERRFQLADYVEVVGASMENGLLHIDLKRELPEAMRPRTISISNGATNGAAPAIDVEAKKA
ncbi:MAG: Hsp20 family protein [Devosiaceae bacterium]|nr:Hsp20 family protein [Devosiaceae bacterium MH13]